MDWDQGQSARAQERGEGKLLHEAADKRHEKLLELVGKYHIFLEHQTEVVI